MNILHTPVSYYKNISDTSSQTTVILIDYLTKPIPSAEQQLRIVRSSKDKVALDEAKAKLPNITPSGTFSYRNDAGLISYSGLIQIDMDRKDNTDHPAWESIPTILKDDPHIAYVGRSASGGSYWGLIPIADPDRRVEHWEALHHRFSEQYGICLDPCTKPICQPRYYSYDPQAYLNPQAVTFTQVMESKPVPTLPQYPARKASTVTDRKKFATYVREICEAKVDITGDRKQWVKVGMAIKSELGDEGLDPYIDICQFSPLFDEAECRKAYHSMKPGSGGHGYGPVTLGTFYMHCHHHGIQPEEYRSRVRVHRPLRKPVESRQTVTAPAPTWVITKPQIARWTQYIQPIEVDELLTEDPSPGPDTDDHITVNYPVLHEVEAYKHPKPSHGRWGERVEALRTFFDGYVHEGPDIIQLYPWLKITDIQKFITAYMELLNNCPPHPVYEPYMERMEQVMGIVRG